MSIFNGVNQHQQMKKSHNKSRGELKSYSQNIRKSLVENISENDVECNSKNVINFIISKKQKQVHTPKPETLQDQLQKNIK